MSHKPPPRVKDDDPGMKGPRSRNEDGQLRKKRGDTLVRTIEDQYHVDFNVRRDMHLETLLQREGVESLNDLLEKAKKRR